MIDMSNLFKCLSKPINDVQNHVALGNALGTHVLTREPLSSYENTCSHVYAHSSLRTWEQALGLGTLGL